MVVIPFLEVGACIRDMHIDAIKGADSVENAGGWAGSFFEPKPSSDAAA